MPQVHSGRYLVCRTITDPLAMVGTMAVVEDLNGDVETISMGNFRINPCDTSWLPHGTILIVKVRPISCRFGDLQGSSFMSPMRRIFRPKMMLRFVSTRPQM